MIISQTIGNLPTAIGDMPGAVHDGALLLFGGACGENVDSKIIRVQPTGQTDIVGQMPAALRGHQAVVVGNIVYLLGGFNDGTSSRVWAMNLSSLEAKEVSPMPRSSAWFAATVVDGRIYVVGGFSIPDGYWNRIAIYDIVKDAWTIESEEFPRQIFTKGRLGSNAVVAIDSRILSFGGADTFNHETMRANALSTSAALNTLSGTWESLEQGISPREGLAAALWEDSVLLVGGIAEGETKASTRLELFDLRDGKVIELGYLQIGRVAPAVGVIGNRLLIAGGVIDPPFVMTDSIEAVDLR